MSWYWPFRKPGPEGKSSWPLVALSEPRSASWGSREPGALIRDGYLRNSVAYRCVRMVSEAAASAPLKTAHEGAGRLLRQPNPEMAPVSFMEALYTDLFLWSCAMQQERRNGAGANAALLETEAGWELIQFREAALIAPERWRLSGLLRGQSGSLSAAAGEGARLVLLDVAVKRAAVTALETGVTLLWRAVGNDEVVEHRFDNRAALPWRPARLPAAPGWVRWARRGRNVADNWDLPDPSVSPHYAVETDFGDGFGAPEDTPLAAMAWPEGAAGVRIAEIGTDGRPGPWLSILAGSSYL